MASCDTGVSPRLATASTTQQRPLTLFANTEHHLLTPLPASPPELACWAKVHGDCHVQYLKCRYSVPFHLIRQTLWLRASYTTVRNLQKPGDDGLSRPPLHSWDPFRSRRSPPA